MHEENEQKPLKINISVENFGPIEKADIDLRPLTVFVGESNTGKTYLATLIYALQRAFEGIPRVPWLYYNTSQIDPIYHTHLAHLPTQASLDEIQETLDNLSRTNDTFLFIDLPEWVRNRLKCGSVRSELLEVELKRCFGFSSFSEMTRFSINETEEIEVSFGVHEDNQVLWSYHYSHSSAGVNIDKVINDNIEFGIDDRDIFKRALNVRDKEKPLRFFMSTSGKTYCLPAGRSSIMETHRLILNSLIERATPTGVDLSGESSFVLGMTADFLNHLINYRETGLSFNEALEIANKLESRVLRGKIELKQLNSQGIPHFFYRPHGSKQVLSMNRSSSMVSNLAPLVLFLRGYVNPGDTLIIEEPEAHLHPKAQTQVAIALARLVRAGVRVIITTHSDWLLQQIANLIREGELQDYNDESTEIPCTLQKEEVGAWWFQSNKPVEEIPFDRIEGIEPKEYEDVADDLYNTFVDLERQYINEDAENKNE